MRGIPSRIGTIRDLENLCDDLPPAKAKELLSSLTDADKARLGLSRKHYIKIRRHVRYLRNKQRKKEKQRQEEISLAAQIATEVEALDDRLGTLYRVLRDLEKELASQGDEAGRGRHRSEIENLQVQIQAHSAYFEDLKKTAAATAAEKKELDHRLEIISRQVERQKEKLIAVRQVRDRLTAEAAEQATSTETLGRLIGERKNEIAALHEQQKKLRAQLAALKKKLEVNDE